MSDHDRTGLPPVAMQRTGAPAKSPIATVCRPRPAKITDRHGNKLAIVYVRQSSPQQVFDHKESRERQYAMADHAVALGWPRDRVLVIDEDQGRSGKTTGQRLGFQHLLAEITMDHVGLVLGLELCRLSRSSWAIRTGSTTPTTPTIDSSWA
jgi:Resolvase, N terminal domain